MLFYYNGTKTEMLFSERKKKKKKKRLCDIVKYNYVEISVEVTKFSDLNWWLTFDKISSSSATF